MNPVARRESEPIVLIHAGAGRMGEELRDEAEPVRRGLLEALGRARAVLEAGGDATTAVIAAVTMMEDVPVFNAGLGSALCADGSVELSAALMRGEDRAAGAVAGLRTVVHPIAAARAVLDSRQVLMIGEAAEALATDARLERRPNDAFVTPRQRERLRAAQPPEQEHGTVGAVCRDDRGHLAAATSTGGISGQPAGRVGDSPLLGAGTWADELVAISCTGDGEAFIRTGVARHVATLLGCGRDLEAATADALDAVRRHGGRGGLIALGADGATAMPFNSEAMLRACWRPGEPPQAWVS